MIRNIVIGVVVGYILTCFDLQTEIMQFIQPYVTFEVTAIVYYIVCAVIACILLKK